jgi:hypothetical protein
MQLSTRVAILPRAMRLLGAATLIVVLMCTVVFAQSINDTNGITHKIADGQAHWQAHWYAHRPAYRHSRVPEPSSSILLAFALVSLGLWSRGKWRASC